MAPAATGSLRRVKGETETLRTNGEWRNGEENGGRPFHRFPGSPISVLDIGPRRSVQQHIIGALVPYRFILVVCLLCAGIARAQTPSAPSPETLFQRLLTAIRQIPIIDNHAHPALIGDAEMDALVFAPTGLSVMEPFLLPLRLRPNNLEYIPALQAFYGYPHTDLTPDHLQELKTLKRKQRSTSDLSYFNSVLEKVGISVSLANRVGMTDAPLLLSRSNGSRSSTRTSFH